MATCHILAHDTEMAMQAGIASSQTPLLETADVKGAETRAV
jgi:hypothetical protein